MNDVLLVQVLDCHAYLIGVVPNVSLRKVLLFRSLVLEKPIEVPLLRVFHDNVDRIVFEKGVVEPEIN